MCGIAGVVRCVGAPNEDDVGRQLELLVHRGPDAKGIFAQGRGVIGQTRLAVIDLVTGDPPVTNESAAIGVALNGEIYNFEELRRELSARGHRLTTVGDTEVIAHFAEEDEPEALARRLHGMFAFAVWDSRRERLILGRDRVGKKPLYYWSNGQSLVFASEIKAVVAHPDVPRRLNTLAIAPFLATGYVPSPDTFYDEIKSLLPGHVLVVDGRLNADARQYWAPPIPGTAGISVSEQSFPEAASCVRAELEEAVRRRLVADVPLGAFLSGGLDSTAVVALMASAASHRIKTFTIGFEDPKFDERAPARQVAVHFDTDHHEIVVRPDAIELLERIVWHFDQPFGDSSALPTYLLAEHTRKHVTVALAGDGGDEIFGGYDRFRAAAVAAYLSRIPALPRRLALWADVLLSRPRFKSSRVRRFLSSASRGLPDAYLDWCNFVLDDETRGRVVPGAEGSQAAMRRVWQDSAGADPLARVLALNFRTYLLDDLLPKVDRMSMAHSLEVRAPMLDHKLVELAFSLPTSYTVGPLASKRILRAAVADLVPCDVLKRTKKGFGVPLDAWFRGELHRFATGLLTGREARISAYATPAEIERLLRDHLRGAANYGHALWSLTQLEVFLRREHW